MGKAAAQPRVTDFSRGDLRFSVRDSGPHDGPVVVLLHGFPQNSSSWEQVAAALNGLGYRTLVPDQRGYSPDATPNGRHSYRITELADDVAELIEQTGLGPVHLVGHDWGAGVAWTVASRRPELLQSLTAVSVPHPAAFVLSMLSSRQALQSYYMLMFQLPWLPELLMRKQNGFFYQMLKRSGQTTPAALRDIGILRRGQTATAAVNWYRALPFAVTMVPALSRPITVPTLQVWSDQDIAVERRGHELSRKFVSGPWQLVVLEGVSHWIPEERPAELASLIDAHAAAAGAG